MFADIRGTRIYFDVDGAGLVRSGDRMIERPAAFLVHGGPGIDHVGARGGCAALRDHMQLVFFDQRGHGRSEREPLERCTLDETVEDMEALRRHLGLGPIVSIGGSYGGMVAMAHAARYPDSVSRLVLFATAAHKGLIDRARAIVAARGSEEQVQMFDRLTSATLDTDAKVEAYFRVMGPLYSRAFDPASPVGSSGRAIYSHEISRRAFGPGGFMQSFDLRGELGNITAPTLILAGRHDFICAPEFSEELHALICNSTLRIFEDSSHLIAADAPADFTDAIIDFVREPELV